jgi:chromosome segregation ATPase
VPNGPAATQPETPPTLEKPLQPEELRRQLTENEAQRKEVTGYINQLSIQLHRWQLRLQKLDERHKELEKELASPGT